MCSHDRFAAAADDDDDDDDAGEFVLIRSARYPTPMESCAYFGIPISETSFQLEVGMQNLNPAVLAATLAVSRHAPPAPAPGALFREYMKLGEPQKP